MSISESAVWKKQLDDFPLNLDDFAVSYVWDILSVDFPLCCNVQSGFSQDEKTDSTLMSEQ